MEDVIVCSGALFYSRKSNRILLIQKAEGKHKNTWGLVGGTTENGETPWQGLQREIKEEIGFLPTIIKTLPLESFVSNDHKFNFYTYLCVIEEEFIPKLSKEHKGWAWCVIENCPKPLHQGLRSSFGNRSIRNKLNTVFEIMDLL